MDSSTSGLMGRIDTLLYTGAQESYMKHETADMTVAERAAEIIEAEDRVRDHERDVSPSTSDGPKAQYVDLEMRPSDKHNDSRDAPFHRHTTERLARNGIFISGIQAQSHSDYDYRVWFNEVSLTNGEMSFTYDE